MRLIRAFTLTAGLAFACASPAATVDVTYRDGRISVSAVDAPLSQLLTTVGHAAGVTLHLQGDLDTPVTLSLTNLGVADTFRRLLENETVALVMIHSASEGDGHEGAVEEVRVYRTTAARSVRVRVSNSSDELRRAKGGSPASRPAAEDAALAKRLDALAGLDRAGRIAAVRNLARRDDPAALEAVADVLATDGHPDVRMAAVEALRATGDERVVPSLEVGLGDEDVEIRGHVVDSIGALGGERALLSLGQVVFGEPNPGIRLTAVNYLAQDPGEAARVFLEAAANDRDLLVRDAARSALGLH